ncbi:MAG: hypothetical protein R3221_11310 [Spongiibacter sp.]|nr:hypothetical protein [Spongiibacter sp.]
MSSRSELEAQGYSFEVREEPIHNEKSSSDRYYRVVVKYQGNVIGTRSEIQQEKALARAYAFAQEHRPG